MNSITIILNLLPTELQRMLLNKDMDNVLTYFMSNDISDEKLAYYLSNLANQMDNKNLSIAKALKIRFDNGIDYKKGDIINEFHN